MCSLSQPSIYHLALPQLLHYRGSSGQPLKSPESRRVVGAAGVTADALTHTHAHRHTLYVKGWEEMHRLCVSSWDEEPVSSALQPAATVLIHTLGDSAYTQSHNNRLPERTLKDRPLIPVPNKQHSVKSRRTCPSKNAGRSLLSSFNHLDCNLATRHQTNELDQKCSTTNTQTPSLNLELRLQRIISYAHDMIRCLTFWKYEDRIIGRFRDVLLQPEAEKKTAGHSKAVFWLLI